RLLLAFPTRRSSDLTWCCLSGWCLGVSRPRSDNTYITRIYLDVNTWLGEVNPPIPHPPEPLPRQMLPRQPRRLEKRPRVHLQLRSEEHTSELQSREN